MSTEMTYADFERLLAVYGSDRTRWPLDARSNAGQLVARSRDARRLLAETEALDRVLDRAPLPSLATEAALAARILVAAQRSPRVVAAQPRDATIRPVAGETLAEAVMAHPQRSVAVASPAKSQWVLAQAGRVRWLRPQQWKMGIGAVVSAASLVGGVLIGLSNLPQPVLRPVQQLTGLPLTVNSSTVAQIDPLDEDLL